MNENTKNQAPNTRMKTPNTKLQTPKKLQISSSNSAVSMRHLGFGAWNFSGAWCLGFGGGSSHLAPLDYRLAPL